MVNPISDAYNLFINIYLSLPAPIQYFCFLAVALIGISTVVSMIFRG